MALLIVENQKQPHQHRNSHGTKNPLLCPITIRVKIWFQFRHRAHAIHHISVNIERQLTDS